MRVISISLLLILYSLLYAQNSNNQTYDQRIETSFSLVDDIPSQTLIKLREIAKEMESESIVNKNLLSNCYLYIAIAAFKAGNKDAIIPSLNKSIAYAPGNVDSLLMRAAYSKVMNNVQQAKVDYLQVLEIYPENKTAKKYIKNLN